MVESVLAKCIVSFASSEKLGMYEKCIYTLYLE